MLVSNNISNLIGKSYSCKTNMQVHFGMNNPKNMLKPKYIPNAVWNDFKSCIIRNKLQRYKI